MTLRSWYPNIVTRVSCEKQETYYSFSHGKDFVALTFIRLKIFKNICE
jgi:hypothetical protein